MRLRLNRTTYLDPGSDLMDACHTRSDCAACPDRMVCHCLQVTEEMLRGALATLELRSLRDLREATGAGDGCTACHRRLRSFLDENAVARRAQASSSSPI